MGTLGLKIDDQLEEKFRKVVFDRKGMKKGNITEALEEAIELWIDPRVADLVKKRQGKEGK